MASRSLQLSTNLPSLRAFELASAAAKGSSELPIGLSNCRRNMRIIKKRNYPVKDNSYLVASNLHPLKGEVNQTLEQVHYTVFFSPCQHSKFLFFSEQK